ncbi:MAG: VanZ family protein [Colwellia sp.]|nr:VanZ family protein [Colwellia sp.]
MSLALTNTPTSYRRFLLFSACFCSVFVVYGSLIPFEMRGHNLAQALTFFSNIRYLQLGVASRADWIANAVIYIPLSFFWCGYFLSHKEKNHFGWGVVLALFSLAVTVEFLQIFISPRTVSLNDLIAEGIGSLLGFGAWVCCGSKLRQILWPMISDRQIKVAHFLLLYSFCYLFLLLFPFDFYISIAELKAGLAQKPMLVFGSLDQITSLNFVLIRVFEVIISIPIGMLIFQQLSHKNIKSILLFFGSIFLFFEFIQLLMISGSVLVLSVLLKTMGVMIGWRIANIWPIELWLSNRRQIVFWMKIFAIPYIFILCILKGWSFSVDVTIDQVISVINNINFIPFYYHYYVTELHALQSLLSQVAMIAPLGCYFYFTETRNSSHAKALVLALSLVVVLILELGGLFLSAMRPDPTNLIIGGLAGLGAYLFTGLLDRSFAKANTSVLIEEDYRQDYTVNNAFTLGLYFSTFIGLITGVVAVIYLVTHPLLSITLVGGFLLLSLLLYTFPKSWLLLLPIGIPILDWYIFSGQFFFTELDGLLLLIISINYMRGYVLLPYWRHDLWFVITVLGLFCCCLISMSQVLLPWPELVVNSFTSYNSPFNVLRISKSLFWAILIFPILNFNFQQDKKVFHQLAYGMLFSLIGVVLVIFVERWIFPGLFDFSSQNYRVKGPFSSMHTGGAHLDSFLLMAFPFIFILLFDFSRKKLLCGLFVLISVLYGAFVTYSRAPFVMIPFLCILLLVGFMMTSKKVIDKGWKILFSGLITIIAILWLSLPFMFDTMLSQRLEQSSTSTNSRVDLWAYTIEMVEGGSNSQLWGNGPGSFPYNMYINQKVDGKEQAQHTLMMETGNKFLRLTSGDNIYTSQYVSLDLVEDYRLRFKARNTSSNANLTLSLCETWIIDSVRCLPSNFNISAGESWRDYERSISITRLLSTFLSNNNSIGRPIALSIHSSSSGNYVDIDDITLLDSQGNNLLENGSFQSKKEHWYFSVDNHTLWHSFNLFVGVYHDFGAVFMILLTILITLSISRLAVLVFCGQQLPLLFLVSITGFLGIGMIDSSFDAPQISLLLYLLIFSTNLMWIKEYPKK